LKSNSIIVCIVLFAAVLIVSQALTVQAINETDNIGMANLSINQAFTNVLAAETAGGNVTGLLAKLNGAGELLAEAERDYQSGNLADVNAKADNAFLLANQVKSDAATLTINSSNNSENIFLLTTTFSIVSIAFFLFGIALIWRIIKRGYYKKLLGSKPEVVNGQT
jgi:hypothetical protein